MARGQRPREGLGEFGEQPAFPSAGIPLPKVLPEDHSSGWGRGGGGVAPDLPHIGGGDGGGGGGRGVVVMVMVKKLGQKLV